MTVSARSLKAVAESGTVADVRRPKDLVRAVLFGAAAVVLGGSGPAHADALVPLGGEAIEVSAEQIDVDVAGTSARLTGHVSLTKGALRVECPHVEVRYEEGPRVTWARGVGGVTADLRGVHAEAPIVELDLGRHVLELRGGVRLTRGGAWLDAEKATIDIETSKVTLQRVHGSIPVAASKP